MINKTPKSLINTDFPGVVFICCGTVMGLKTKIYVIPSSSLPFSLSSEANIACLFGYR